MKCNILCANTSDQSLSAVIEQLGKNNIPGSNHIFITPNRFSISIEQELFDSLNLDGAVNIDIVPFSRFATNALKNISPRHCLTNEGGVLILKKVIDKQKNKLKRYKNAVEMSSFPKNMFSIISTIRDSGYTAEDLEARIPSLLHNIGYKVHDIALLCRAYENALIGDWDIESEIESGNASADLVEQIVKDDSITKLERFALVIRDIPNIAITHIYIGAFNSFTSKEKDIIKELIRFSKSVSIALTTGTDAKNRSWYPVSLVSTIEELANIVGAEVSIIKSSSQILEPFSTINRELFAYSGEKAKNTHKVIPYKENTLFDEANGIAREISRLVRRENYRYKDIAVINCNPTFEDILISIFERYDIPYFADVKYPLQETMLAGYLVTALEVVDSNFNRDMVFKLLKSPLFSASYDSVCSFENFVIKHDINRHLFLKPFTEFKGVRDIDVIESTRIKLMTLLSDIPSTSCSARHFIGICRSIVGGADFLLALEDAIEKIKNTNRYHAVNIASKDKFESIFSEFEELLCDYQATFAMHIETLKASISSVQLALIPQSIDSVFVGNIAESRFNNLKAVFVTEVSSTMFPSEEKNKQIITAGEFDLLSANGVHLYPSPHDRMREQEFLLLDLVARIKEYLYIGFAVSLPNGESCVASIAFKEICNICNVDISNIPSLNARYLPTNTTDEKSIEDCAVTVKNAYFQYLALTGDETLLTAQAITCRDTLYNALDDYHKAKASKLSIASSDAVSDKEEKSTDPDSNTAFIPPLELMFFKAKNGSYKTSVSQLETYFKCPHLHFLKYGMKIRQRETADISYFDIGIIMHKCLEIYFKDTLNRLREMNEQEVNAAAHDAMIKAINLEVRDSILRDLTKVNIINRIKKECVNALKILTANVIRSKYTPAFVEAKFGEDETFPSIIIDTEKACFCIQGKIDRIDVYNNNAVAFDYKTTSASASVKESDILCGTNIQLHIYLNAIKSQNLTPVGSCYIVIKDSYSKNKENAFGLVGQIAWYACENEVISDFDTKAYEQAFSTHQLTSSPNLVANIKWSDKQKKVLPTSQKCFLDSIKFEETMSYVVNVSKLGLEEICNGYIAKSPIGENRCSSCIYSAICMEEGKKYVREAPGSQDS